MTEAPSAPVPVIAIDGPSGAGKGTLASRLASHLGWHLLDSGAVYRLLAMAAVSRGVELDDGAALAALARALDVRFARLADGSVVPLLDGCDVSRQLRTELVGEGASRVAALAQVREALLALQRSFRCPPGLVADGRDMRSVVFPDAQVSFFLTADVRERAARRYKQLKDKGVDANLSALLEEIASRDRRDRERAVAPLVVSDDAIVLDSTGKSIDEVLAEALAALPPDLAG